MEGRLSLVDLKLPRLRVLTQGKFKAWPAGQVRKAPPSDPSSGGNSECDCHAASSIAFSLKCQQLPLHASAFKTGSSVCPEGALHAPLPTSTTPPISLGLSPRPQKRQQLAHVHQSNHSLRSACTKQISAPGPASFQSCHCFCSKLLLPCTAKAGFKKKLHIMVLLKPKNSSIWKNVK